MANACGQFSPHLVSVALQVVFQCDPFPGTFSSMREDPISLFLPPRSPLCSCVRPAEPAATGPKGEQGTWDLGNMCPEPQADTREDGAPPPQGRSSQKQPAVGTEPGPSWVCKIQRAPPIQARSFHTKRCGRHPTAWPRRHLTFLAIQHDSRPEAQGPRGDCASRPQSWL